MAVNVLTYKSHSLVIIKCVVLVAVCGSNSSSNLNSFCGISSNTSSSSNSRSGGSFRISTISYTMSLQMRSARFYCVARGHICKLCIYCKYYTII